jgi:hypothetical protein
MIEDVMVEGAPAELHGVRSKINKAIFQGTEREIEGLTEPPAEN